MIAAILLHYSEQSEFISSFKLVQRCFNFRTELPLFKDREGMINTHKIPENTHTQFFTNKEVNIELMDRWSGHICTYQQNNRRFEKHDV